MSWFAGFTPSSGSLSTSHGSDCIFSLDSIKVFLCPAAESPLKLLLAPVKLATHATSNRNVLRGFWQLWGLLLFSHLLLPFIHISEQVSSPSRSSGHYLRSASPRNTFDPLTITLHTFFPVHLLLLSPSKRSLTLC